MTEIAARLRRARLVPVLTIRDAAQAVPLARALLEGGIGMLEVTLRSAAGAEAAQAIMREVPEAEVGLGTVLSPSDLELAQRIGARFAFSPGATPELLDAAAASGLPFVPGIATASEYMACAARGFGTVKLFPARELGGLNAVKALAGPFPEALFCPTGGIGEADAPAWLAQPNVVAVGGSWLAPPAMVAAGDWAGITAIAKRSLSALGG